MAAVLPTHYSEPRLSYTVRNLTECYGPNVCLSPNSHVEILIPSMMVFEGDY